MLLKLVPEETSFKFMKFKKVAMGLSILLMIASAALFFVRGLNLGIDFAGGLMMEVGTQTPADVGDFRAIVGNMGLGDVAIQEFGSNTDFLIRIERQPGEADAQQAAVKRVQTRMAADMSGLVWQQKSSLENTELSFQTLGITSLADGVLYEVQGNKAVNFDALRSSLTPIDEVFVKIEPATTDNSFFVFIDLQGQDLSGLQDEIAQVQYDINLVVAGLSYRRVEFVGPKVSGELVRDGVLAVLFAVGAVLVYIWLRFEWHFGVGAVIALIHDVSLTIGFFALTGLEFNLSIIAAILTIVGYSLNDTVVVYDRIREKLRKYRKMPLEELLDFAINKTLSRTLMTSVTTLLALGALFFFGGEVIRGFTAAMIWGVFVGTYSSIFIASPALLYLKLKQTDITLDEGEKSTP